MIDTKDDLSVRQLSGLLRSKEDFLDFINMEPVSGDVDNFTKVRAFLLRFLRDDDPPAMPDKKKDGTKEWREYPWHEKLSWCKDYTHADSNMLEKMKIINDFLVTLKEDDPSIPIKERSLLLFGNEHILDEISKSRLFLSGKMTLDTLRCYRTWLPIVHETFEPSLGRTIIIENRDTFFSFCKACGETSPSPYKHVIFSNGTSIYDSIAGIKDLPLDRKDIEFFGDVDALGMEIPIRLREAVADMDGLTVRIAEPFYDKAMELYAKCSYRIPAKKYKWRESHLKVLPERFQNLVKDLYLRSERIPQEIVNYIEIKKILEGMN